MSPNRSDVVRARIEAQGFCGHDDATLARINFPLRLAPAICMIWVAAATASGSAVSLWALAPFALLGALLHSHPFDVIYNHGLRHWLGSPALPRYGARRRFACALATLMIVAAAWSFETGATLAGVLVGGSLVAAAFVNVSTGFCIPSFLVWLFFGKVVCVRNGAAARNA